MAVASNFKDLQRKARKIEIEIDHKLVAFSKIKNPNQLYHKQEEEPLLDEDDTNNRKIELENLLSRFSAVLDELSDVAEISQNGMQLRNVQQLRTVYENDVEEFRKMCTSLLLAAAQAEELKSVPMSRSAAAFPARRQRNDAALRENQSAHSSIQMVNEHIALALETREQLGAQRSRFKAIQTRMNDLFSNLPRVNNLLQKIHSRKRIEAVIIGVLIGVLTIASLAFQFS